jgi:AraC family transcriptional regulator
MTGKQFMIGLKPGPPPGYVSHDFEDFSVYTAEQPRSVWERHTHDCTQITVALSPARVRGEWVGTAGAIERREMCGNMAWIVPPRVPHVIHFDQSADLIHLYLTESFFHETIEDTPPDFQGSVVPSLLVRDPYLVEIARAFYAETRTGATSKLYMQSVAAITAVHLRRRYSSSARALRDYRGGLGPMRERRLLAYINENLGESLSLNDLAQVAQVSPNYLISLFRQSMGLTPHQYLLQQRVARAKHLLAGSPRSFSEIAAACGFQDGSQFSTVFRKYTGNTPTAYRQSVAGRP